MHVELASPELISAAVVDRLAERVDVRAAGVPSSLSGVDFDPMVGKNAANGVLQSVDVVVDAFAKLDERTLLADKWLGHMNGHQSLQQRHFGKFQCVVTIGFSLGGLPRPGFLVGAADERFDTFGLADVVDPARGPAGFHHDEVDVGPGFQQEFDMGTFGGDGLELVVLSGRIKEAADAVKLAKVDCTCNHEWLRGLGCQRVSKR